MGASWFQRASRLERSLIALVPSMRRSITSSTTRVARCAEASVRDRAMSRASRARACRSRLASARPMRHLESEPWQIVNYFRALKK